MIFHLIGARQRLDMVAALLDVENRLLMYTFQTKRAEAQSSDKPVPCYRSKYETALPVRFYGIPEFNTVKQKKKIREEVPYLSFGSHGCRMACQPCALLQPELTNVVVCG